MKGRKTMTDLERATETVTDALYDYLTQDPSSIAEVREMASECDGSIGAFTDKLRNEWYGGNEYNQTEPKNVFEAVAFSAASVGIIDWVNLAERLLEVGDIRKIG
jgi:hypothetical protein